MWIILVRESCMSWLLVVTRAVKSLRLWGILPAELATVDCALKSAVWCWWILMGIIHCLVLIECHGLLNSQLWFHRIQRILILSTCLRAISWGNRISWALLFCTSWLFLIIIYSAALWVVSTTTELRFTDVFGGVNELLFRAKILSK